MRKNRDYSFHIYMRGIILIGFFLLLLKLLVTGNIQYFIAPKMVPFSYFSIGVFFILGFVQIWRSNSKNEGDLYCNCGFDHKQSGSPFQSIFIYSLFVLPVLTGLLFPNSILDSSVAAKRGIKYGSSIHTKGQEVNSNETEITINVPKEEEYLGDPGGYMESLDKKMIEDFTNEQELYGDPVMAKEKEKLKDELLSNEKIIVDEERYLPIMDMLHDYRDLFIGKEIEIIGFVYKEPNFESDQFVIARFGISCCVADASVYGIMATMMVGNSVREDEWVRATGILSKINQNDLELPYLQITNIEKMDEPENPYVYELLIPLIGG